MCGVHERPLSPTPADDRGDASGKHGTGGTHLRCHPSRAKAGPRASCHGRDASVNLAHTVNELCAGVSLRISRVEPVHVREDHVQVCRDEPGHNGAKHVVVSKGELGHGDGVVLVDNRHGTELDETHQGVARVEVRLAIHNVAAREQDLSAGDAALGKDVCVGLGELCLTRGRTGLERHDVRGTLGKPQLVPACRCGTRGDENHVRTLVRKLDNLVAERADKSAVERAVLVHKGGRSHLGNDERRSLRHYSSPPSSRTSGSSSASSA